MATQAEQLILRGLSLLIRTTFSPNDAAAQAKHFIGLQADIGPWLKDYADEIAKPTDEEVEAHAALLREENFAASEQSRLKSLP
jgi:hypothetical protein